MTSAAHELCTLQTTEDNRVRVAKAKWLLPWSQTPVTVNCSTPGLIVITPYDKPLERRLCLAARGVYDNTPGRPFQIMVANLSNSPTHLPKRMNIALAQDVPDMIVAADTITATNDKQDVEGDVHLQEGGGKKDQSGLATHERQKGETGSPGPVYISQATKDDKRRSVIRAKTIDWQEQVTREKSEEQDWRTKIRLGASFEKNRDRIERLLEPYQDMWSGQLGQLKATEHRIELEPGSKPVHQAPYRAGPLQREMEKKEIDNMLEKGVIEPATTDWASPIVFVPKADGSLRFCVDYRRLNAMTVRDSYPIPRMDECIDSLGSATVFSTLDCNSGYWQIPMAPKDMDKTAFISHYGLYRFRRMPFGLKNAPGTFQRIADIILASVKWQNALVYLDDVIVYSLSLIHISEPTRPY